MVFEHDYNNFPELTNKQLAEFGFMSPHEQITRDFVAEVIKVSDGDTVTLRVDFRDFDFPLRFLSVDAPELNTGIPGEEAKNFLAEMVEGEQVIVKIDRFNRVGRYGRLLGDIVIDGIVVSDIMQQLGFALPFGRRREGSIDSIEKQLGMVR